MTINRLRTRGGVLLGWAVLSALVLGATACSSSPSTTAAVPCPQYDASILNPRPLAANLDPATAMPSIDSMPSTSAALGTKQALKPTWYTQLTVTPAQQQAICAKHLTGVYMDWAGVPFNQAIRWGIKDMFAALGIKLLRITNWNINTAGFPADLAAVLPLKPDIILTGGPVSPEQFAAIMKPAIDQGATVATWGLGAKDWNTGAGQPLKTVVGYDFYYLGVQLADAIHKAYPNGANVGYMHWVNNALAILNREQGMLDELKKFPNINIVTNGAPSPSNPASGYTDVFNSEPYALAFLKQHPNVDVLFGPWEDAAALGEVAAVKALGLQGKVHVATMDLSTDGANQILGNGTINVDMAQGMFDGGRSMALSAALSEIGAPIFPYVIVPTTPATSLNVKDAWEFMHGPDMPFGG